MLPASCGRIPAAAACNGLSHLTLTHLTFLLSPLMATVASPCDTLSSTALHLSYQLPRRVIIASSAPGLSFPCPQVTTVASLCEAIFSISLHLSCQRPRRTTVASPCEALSSFLYLCHVNVLVRQLSASPATRSSLLFYICHVNVL